MDPLSAIGVAAAVVQFLDIGVKIARRLSEYNNASTSEVPKSLQSINAQLPLQIKALGRVKSDVDVNKFDTDTRCSLRSVVSGCTKLVEDVETIMNKVSRQEGESMTLKLRKVLASFKHDEKIVAIDKNLQTYVQVLILHHVVDSKDVPTGLAEDVTYFEVREKRADPFVERDLLTEKLDKAFFSAARSQAKVPVTVVLQGEKAAGKSQLALDYCHQSHAAGQFQTVFWLNAETPESLNLSLESAAAVIRRSTEGSRNEKLDFVSNFLAERWHPWLLVLDNYNHQNFQQRGVMHNLPTSGYGAILITTRNLAASSLGQVIEVSRFLTADEESDLRWKLTSGVYHQEIDKVRYVISQGFNVNGLDTNGWPFLSRAALHGSEETVKLLLAQGADIHLKPNQTSPLAWAAGGGHLSVVNCLLDYEDAQVVRLKQEQYDAAVRGALEKGHIGVIRLLMSRRQENLDVKDSYGASGFARAAREGHLELLQLLSEHGAAPTKEEDKASALCRAAEGGHLEIVKLLCSQARFHPNLADSNGTTALYHAVALRDSNSSSNALSPKAEEMTRFLLSKGADPTLARKDDKETALHRAALNDHTVNIRLLLDAGADPTAQDYLGYTPLLTAAKYKSPAAITLLLAAPIKDTPARTDYKNQALKYAARNGSRELALAVLRSAIVDPETGTKDVTIDSVDWSGKTPLLLSIVGGHVQTARLLIRHNPSQEIADSDGRLPLLAAAIGGQDLVVRDLLRAKGSKGPDGVKDKDENTALHLAAAKGHEAVVRVLLEAGADREEVNVYGESAVDVAEEKKLKRVVRLLQGLEVEEEKS